MAFSRARHPHRTLGILGLIHVAQGRHKEAELLFRDALEVVSPLARPILTSEFRGGLGAALVAMGQYEVAEPNLLEAHELLRDRLGDENHVVRRICRSLAELYEAWDKPDKAAEWRAKLAGEEVANEQEAPR